jgi:hypothetical protein
MFSLGECRIELACRRYPGKIITKGEGKRMKYLDQVWLDDGTWIGAFHMRSYLQKYYGLTMQQYYNILMYGDPNKTPICRCGKKLKFLNFSHGYTKTCCDEVCENELHRLAGIRYATEFWLNITKEEKKQFSAKMSEAYKRYRESLTLENAIFEAEFMRDNFINRGNPNDICYFYIANNKGKFKYGITHNLKARIRSYSRDPYYYRIKPLFETDRITVAYFECKIKIELFKLNNKIGETLEDCDIKLFRQVYNKLIDNIKF